MSQKMSTSSQNNGKKSSNNSIVNTPSSTPITNIANGSTPVNSQGSPPPNNNAPKYGTLVPNRIFVGGISANTTEGELMQLFSTYGTVKAAKIIQDRAGVSKGYGFITFESEDDAKRPLREAENIVLRERKLNIAPAIKKQPFSRAFDASSPSSTVAAGNPTQFFFPPGAAVPYFQGGVAYYPQPAPAAADPSAQQPVYQRLQSGLLDLFPAPPMYPTQTGPPQTAAYPSMMFPAQPIYMPQQYPMPMPYDYTFYQNSPASSSTQYAAGPQSSSGGSQCTPMPSSNSPPRPPCYGQQVPTYSSGDPIYYNMPIYGATLEGPPLYTESFELAPNGSYAEESYNSLDGTLSSQDLDTSRRRRQTSAVPVAAIPVVPTNSITSHNTRIISAHPVVLTASSDTNNGGRKQQSYNRSTEVNMNRQQQSDDRNSHTPVVSLLSIDHQQEKDYSSMQRGRRLKPLQQGTQNNLPLYSITNDYSSNPFLPSFVRQQQRPPPLGMYNNGYATGFTDYRRYIGYEGNRPNEYYNKPRRRNDNRRSNDTSNRSNMRPDSNSSASCVDENRNEEKTMRTNVNTPPPAPYSPMTHTYKILNSNSKNSFSRQLNNNEYSRPTTTPSGELPYVNDVATAKNKNGSISNNSNNAIIINNPSNSASSLTNKSCSNSNSTLRSPNSPPSLNNSQVSLNTTTSQSFVPHPHASSRNKRLVRRSGGTGANEIGAADTPVQGEVAVSDVCKKLETLNL